MKEQIIHLENCRYLWSTEKVISVLQVHCSHMFFQERLKPWKMCRNYIFIFHGSYNKWGSLAFHLLCPAFLVFWNSLFCFDFSLFFFFSCCFLVWLSLPPAWLEETWALSFWPHFSVILKSPAWLKGKKSAQTNELIPESDPFHIHMQKLTKPKSKNHKNYHPQKENPTKQQNNNPQDFIFL